MKSAARLLHCFSLDARISRDATTVFLPVRAFVGIAIEILNCRSAIANRARARLPSVPQFATLLPGEVLKFRKLEVVVSCLAGLQSSVQASRIQSFKVRSSILGL
jgi:hypothetical protein